MSGLITGNLAQVRKNIEEACRSVGRDPREVTLIAVSKTKPVSALSEAYAAGQRVFGENKVQEIQEKYDCLPRDISWHMIGHLQRNKVKYIVDKVELIHSVDTLALAEQIEKEAARRSLTVEILVQVNVAGEDTKFGLAPEEVSAFLEKISPLSHVHVAGLMTSAPYVADPEENRCYFKKLHKLFVDIRAKNVNNIDMNILSMGMTNDYEIAVEEGATMVRVGTGIFGERNYNK